MRKYGFTLAEVLVTLGIIGIITSLALPTFTADTHNRANASKLASVVADYENVFGMMLVKEDKMDLIDTEFGTAVAANNDTGIKQALSKYVKMGRAGNTISDLGYSSGMKNIRNGAETLTFTEGINTNTGASVFIYADNSTRTESAAVTAGAGYATKTATVYIDVNGSAVPNKYGRDIFGFVLGGDGLLYPYGSLTASFLNNESSNPIWSGSNTTYGCQTGEYLGLGCTARLIENNYKMDY